MAGIGAMHGAIADRAFGLSGPGASPARVVHDTISEGVYGALRTGAGVVGKGADVVLGQRLVVDGRTVSTTPRGAFALGVITGLVGDALERTEPDLAEPISVRVPPAGSSTSSARRWPRRSPTPAAASSCSSTG